MITFRFSLKLVSLLMLSACSSDEPEVHDPDRVLTLAEEEFYDQIGKPETEPTSIPTYSISDFAGPTPTALEADADAEDQRQLQEDLRNQEIDRRIRQLEQDAELRRTEEDLRKANERVEAVK